MYVLALTLWVAAYIILHPNIIASYKVLLSYYLQFTQKNLDFVGSILRQFWKNASIFHVWL